MEPVLSPAPRWSRGLSSNLAALAFAAVAGVVANIVVARDFGPSGFGVFSQTLTVFILAAQVAALGIHYAVLQRTALAKTREESQQVVDVGVTLVAPIALAIALLVYLLAPAIGSLADSAPLVGAVRWSSLALFFHALAKVVAAGLNGEKRMSAFSTVLAARAGGILAMVLVLGAVGKTTSSDLGLVFVASEVLALAVALVHWGGIRTRWAPETVRELISFGFRAAVAALTVEVNSKIDIVVLGVMLSDEVVGVYALAATAFDGALQVFAVLRNQMNPLLSEAIGEGMPEAIDALCGKLRLWTRSLALVGLVGVLAFTGAFVDLLGLSPAFLEARLPLALLLSGLVVAAPILPFDQLLVVTGRPGPQARVVLLSLAVNLGLNLVLVPLIGGPGAAIGTAAALSTLALGISIYGNRLLGTNLRLLAISVRTNS